MSLDSTRRRAMAIRFIAGPLMILAVAALVWVEYGLCRREGRLAAAFLLETILPDPPLTRAMVGVLDHDDDVGTEETCERLGIRLTPLDRTLQRCVGPQEAAP